MMRLALKTATCLLFIACSMVLAIGFFACGEENVCAHKWNEGEITKIATCSAEGEKTFTCTLCNETNVEKIKAIGHQYSEEWVDTDSEGHYHICTVCNEFTDEVLTHMFVDGDIIKEPTATDSGLQQIYCSECGYESTKSISQHTHSLVKTEKLEPTCENSGFEAYWTCSGCNKIFSDENGTTELKEIVSILALGHSYGEPEWIWEGNKATAKFVCANDSDHIENIIATISSQVKFPATCEEKGTTTYMAKVTFKNEDYTTSKDIQDIPLSSEHNYGDDWKSDENGHWHECTSCGVKSEINSHTPNIENATADTSKSCTICGYVIQPALGHTHSYVKQVAEEEYLVSTATCAQKAIYYYSCECGEKGTETFEYGELVSHTYEVKFDDTNHWNECRVCHATADEQVHTWNEGIVTTKPTLTTDGEKTYTCGGCEATKTEAIAAEANFENDFTLEDGQLGSWKYGSVNYQWGDNENFTFTQSENKNDGGDGWSSEGVEIKGGWINSNNNAAISYTVESDITIKVNLNFIGGTELTKLGVRVGIKNADGVIYNKPEFIKDENSNVLNVERTYELKAGDTIYFIFFNENSGDPTAFPSGDLDIVLTEVTA